MEPHDLPLIEEVAAAIAQRRLGVDAAELHGSLCGFLSAGGVADRDAWLQQLSLDADAPPGAADGALDQLFLASVTQLADPELGFVLLLPDEDLPLSTRADALLGWCRGFLGGFGLVPAPGTDLSPEAAEALEDMAKIAASSLSYDDPVGDEAALVEVAEFVRVAALLLHGDRAAVPRDRQRLH